jgi:hypothetical protein
LEEHESKEVAALRAEVQAITLQRDTVLDSREAVRQRERSLRAEVERLRRTDVGNLARVAQAQADDLTEASALLEGLDDLLQQTMTNTPHPPSFSDWKDASTNIRAFLAANSDPASAKKKASNPSLEPSSFLDLPHAKGPCRNCEDGGDSGYCPRDEPRNELEAMVQERAAAERAALDACQGVSRGQAERLTADNGCGRGRRLIKGNQQ